MKFELTFFMMILGAVAIRGASVESSVARRDTAAGAALVLKLQHLHPEELVHVTGMVSIKKSGLPARNIPFEFDVQPLSNSWQVAYKTAGINSHLSETLIVERTPGKPNQYWHITAAASGSPLSLVTNRVVNPTNELGGSDFCLGDLGLEFLFWHDQAITRTEMKMGRVCKVLESKPSLDDHSLGYSRVVSWIDHESGGILTATAYGSNGKALKEFEINDLQKVDGQYQLQEMEMRNVLLKSRTRLTFDFDKNKSSP